MLAFNDDQVKNMTKDALLLPVIINDPATGLKAQKQAVINSTENLKKTDEGQKVFSDFFIDVCTKYHTELALLNNTQRTNYSNANIDLAGRSTGPHFPTEPAWVNFTPKLIDSVIGLPVTTLTNVIESDYSTKLNELISILKNGFNDNSFSASVNMVGNTFTINSSISGLANGNRLAGFSGSTFFIARVTNITSTSVTNPQTQVVTTTTVVTVNLLYGTLFSGSGSVQASLVGFTNNQRTGVTSTVPNTNVYTAVTGILDTTVANWKAYIQTIKNTLDANGDLPPRKAHIVTASTQQSNALATLTTWQGKTATAVGGRFSDAGLQPVIDMIPVRAAQMNARITEIIADLGTVTQNADGTYTGTGAYGELFKQIDLRSAKGSGTLSAANGGGLGLSFFDKRIATSTEQLTQYTSIFLIIKMTEDSTIGQIDFKLENVNNLAVGDTVKIMDNESAVYTRTISAILPQNTIRLNSGIPAELSTGNLLRVVKQQ